MNHLLDRPVWTALDGRQRSLSVGDERARRFDPAIGPLAAARDNQPTQLEGLAALVGADQTLLLLQADDIALPDSMVAIDTADGVQMLAEELVAPSDAHRERIEPLTFADVPQMIELATLTKPGPFGPRTAELAPFIGIKHDGRLVAMAGERLQHDGFAEVSGVCTHPDARGLGYGRALSLAVATRIAARGAVPYLHAYASNEGALRLYESLGFRVRRRMNVATIGRATRA